MKHTLIATATVLLTAMLATAALAQGRHDEKPHGTAKATVQASETTTGPIWGGRHDERPHGPKRPVPMKQEPKDGIKAAPSSSGNEK